MATQLPPIQSVEQKETDSVGGPASARARPTAPPVKKAIAAATGAVSISPNVLLPESPKFWAVLLYRVSPRGLKKYFLVQYDDSPAQYCLMTIKFGRTGRDTNVEAARWPLYELPIEAREQFPELVNTSSQQVVEEVTPEPEPVQPEEKPAVESGLTDVQKQKFAELFELHSDARNDGAREVDVDSFGDFLMPLRYSAEFTPLLETELPDGQGLGPSTALLNFVILFRQKSMRWSEEEALEGLNAVLKKPSVLQKQRKEFLSDNYAALLVISRQDHLKMRSIFEDYASRDPITGNFLITYSDIGPILKNLQPYLPEKFTSDDKRQLKKLAKNNTLRKAAKSAKIDFQHFKRNLELVFGSKSKVRVESVEQKGVMALRKVRLSTVQLVNLKSLFKRSSKAYTKKDVDDTSKLVRVIDDRALVLMIPEMEPEQNPAIGIKFNSEQLKHIFALIRDANIFEVNDFIEAVSMANDSKTYPKEKFSPKYYSPEDRYGALLTLSYEQRSTLRAVFDKYAKRINNSFLLNSEYFPKFLEDMNAEESIPWKFLKGGKDDEFGDAVLLAETSKYISYFQLTNVLLPRLFLQAASQQDMMTVREVYSLYENKRKIEQDRGAPFDEEDLTQLAVKLGLAEIAPDFVKDMKRFDADKDGTISFEEFLTYVRAAFKKLKKTVANTNVGRSKYLGTRDCVDALKRAVEARVDLIENYIDLDKELDTIEKHFSAMGQLPEVANEFNRVNRDAEALRARVQKDQELHDGVFRDLAEQQEQQVSASLGEEGSERALQEFNTARASLKWIKNFFTNQMQTFLAADLQGLKKWSPQQEIPQPGYAPGAIRMAPTVAVGVDGIIATLNRMKRDDTFAKRLRVNADKLDDVLEHFDRLQRSIKKREAKLADIRTENAIKRDRLKEKTNLKRVRTRENVENKEIRHTEAELEQFKKKAAELVQQAFRKRSITIEKRTEIKRIDKMIADLTVEMGEMKLTIDDVVALQNLAKNPEAREFDKDRSARSLSGD